MDTTMHATIEQLLEIKDGERNVASNHVRTCARCQQELALLGEICEQLFRLADQRPHSTLWHRIEQTAMAERVPMELLAAQVVRQPQQSRSLSHAVYTLAASILFTGFIGLYMFSQSLNSGSQNELLQANIQELMINSRSMEQALEKVTLESELLTASQRSQADRLYWQLAYLDQMIHDSSINAESDPARTEVLWNNRVEALRELKQIYYQRQQSLSESEI